MSKRKQIAHRYMNAEERFWLKVSKNKEGCWNWIGAISPLRGIKNRGYGFFHVNKNKVQAHRFSYELAKEKIPEDFVIDHLCKNSLCVNPAHLEAVTSEENTMRGNSPQAINARKTHCHLGHKFTPENTYTQPSRPKSRTCRACQKIKWTETKEKKKERSSERILK